ncbi:type II secretion system F family protein [Blastopirellula sp. JC732]|uniref:Type II secretion system F family protein n=1 Tax=Blastopirellula sediminis TaxID=2894196 RepID=A0A9X1MK78_9BACT|nr:type II secretion system F family protein [Blastopirellula sediminis]MCC9608580.1 type II secretion system F family protein [Blastopirellula sediminis]MCC9628643.1 type II secretion system F family protein [Blastopirellula sediminis]
MSQFQIISSLLLGLAGFGLAWTLLDVLTRPRLARPGQNKFELTRRQAVRQNNSIYRWFEPLIDEWAASGSLMAPERREQLERQVRIASERNLGTPDEFLATKIIEGILIGLGFAIVGALAGFWLIGLVAGAFIAVSYSELSRSTISDRATRRMMRIRLRLPHAIELVCLMMEAGAGFQDSLETAVRENVDHPLGQELNVVVQQIAAGRTRHDALADFQQRLSDEDVSELVFAINKGEELGTPLAVTLRNQSEQMRLKRSQWGEKAAGEAQVKIVFPGMLIMIACLLVIVTPLIYPLVNSIFGI